MGQQWSIDDAVGVMLFDVEAAVRIDRGLSTRSVTIWVTTKQQSGRQLLSFKSTVATVFDTVDECNCGVLATQASVGPTRVGCYFLIVIATAGAGGFYRSTGLLAGIVARSVDNHDRSRAHGRATSATQPPVALIFDCDSRRSMRGVQLSLGRSGRRPSNIPHQRPSVGEAQQPTTREVSSVSASHLPRRDSTDRRGRG